MSKIKVGKEIIDSDLEAIEKFVKLINDNFPKPTTEELKKKSPLQEAGFSVNPFGYKYPCTVCKSENTEFGSKHICNKTIIAHFCRDCKKCFVFKTKRPWHIIEGWNYSTISKRLGLQRFETIGEKLEL